MSTKNVVFGLQTTFLDGFNVLLSFLTQKWYRTNMKLPQQASFGPETCEVWPKVAIWGIRRTGFPHEDSPSFTEHPETVSHVSAFVWCYVSVMCILLTCLLWCLYVASVYFFVLSWVDKKQLVVNPQDNPQDVPHIQPRMDWSSPCQEEETEWPRPCSAVCASRLVLGTIWA